MASIQQERPKKDMEAETRVPLKEEEEKRNNNSRTREEATMEE